MRRHNVVRFGLTVGILVVAVSARPSGPQDQPRRTFRTETNYVRVDVYPTRDGAIVPGLSAADFEILEDDVAQRVEHCEFVGVRTGAPLSHAREPASAAAAAQDARSRLFVLFLDTYHVGTGGSARMRGAISMLLRRALGPDDVVGLMTPHMSAADMTFTRRLDELEAMLDREWIWGRRDQTTYREPVEVEYEGCYPERSLGGECTVGSRKVFQPDNFYRGIAREMIDRRREVKTIEALEDLTRWLRDLREDRKAVFVVSDGWRLYGPDPTVQRQGPCDPAGLADGVTLTGPPGRAGTGPSRSATREALQKCDRDRMVLANLDNARAFRGLLDRANRANVTFYPIDPRGLPAIDTSISDTKVSAGGVTQPLLTPSEDARQLTGRIDSLQTLAAATDGMAVAGSNDIERGLARVAADMAAYYLLGYYSTNTRLDGKFRRLDVRVRRQGVEVRARRGYTAATAEEVAAGRSAGDTPVAPEASTTMLADAIAALSTASVPSPLRAGMSWLAYPHGAGGARVWAVAELDRTLTRAGGELASGLEITATLSSATGAEFGEQRAALRAGAGVAAFEFALSGLESGTLALRFRVNPAGGGLPMTETVRVTVTAPAASIGPPRLFRRGGAAASPASPTADARFSRTERLRVDIPVAGDEVQAAAQVLDRRGHPLPLPVACATREARADEPAWASCELRLAPLAPGDYVVRTAVTVGDRRTDLMTAFRVQ